MIVCGLYVSDAPLLTGKVLSHMTTNFVSLFMIILSKRLNVSLPRMERDLSLITLICLSISGTCSLVTVELTLTSGKSRTSQSKSLSISKILILKPLVL